MALLLPPGQIRCPARTFQYIMRWLCSNSYSRLLTFVRLTTMGKILILLALSAVTFAAPPTENIKTLEITRPSPINPDVISDPKPPEKIVLIKEDRVQPLEKLRKRDIPVPTAIKTTLAPKEDEEKPQVEDLNVHVPVVESTTPHSPLRHHPVPVAELFNKPKSTASPASSEESKEDKDSKEDKA